MAYLLINHMNNTDNTPTKQKKRQLTLMQDKLLANLASCKTWKEAALKAGYSESTAGNIKQVMSRFPPFTNAIKERYINNNTLQLIDIGMIESNVLAHCKDPKNIDNVPKHAQTLKQIKQAAGVLDIEPATKSITININAIEKIQVAMAEVLRSRMIPVHSDDDA